jgi:signal peptidase II
MPDLRRDQHEHSVQPEFLNSLRSDNGIPIDRNTRTDLMQDSESAGKVDQGQCGDAELDGFRCLSEASLGTQEDQCSHVDRPPRSLTYVWLVLAVVVIGLDQASKLSVLATFAPGEVLPVNGVLNLVLVFNPGAAFSFLADAGGWQKWFFLSLAIAVSVWGVRAIRQEPEQKYQAAALSLIMGGALGNAIDRVAYGAVVDFLDVHWAYLHWPAFNVADSAICVGAVLLVWDQMRRKPSAETAVQTVHPSE